MPANRPPRRRETGVDSRQHASQSVMSLGPACWNAGTPGKATRSQRGSAAGAGSSATMRVGARNGGARAASSVRVVNYLIAGALGVIAVGVVLFAVLGGDRGPSADLRLSLSDLSYDTDDTEAGGADPERIGIRFAAAAVLSPTAMLDDYQALTEYLSQRLDRPVELVQGRSYAETNALVRSGDVALALVCSGAYVEGRRSFGMLPLVMPVVNGETPYRSYLIVSSESDTEGWQDLRGATFAFTDPLSNTGRLVPVYVLAQMGESPEEFFEGFIFTYSHDKSVEAVADGLVDAAAVDSRVYDSMQNNNPAIMEKTKVIWRSPPFGINPVVVHPDADAELRKELETVFLTMSEDPEGQRVLALLDIDSWVEPIPGAYDTIEDMIDKTAPR